MLKSHIFFLATLLVSTIANAKTDLNPIRMAKTSARFTAHFSPTLQVLTPFTKTAPLNTGVGIGMDLDVPIWKYFAAGAFFQITTMNTLKNDSDFGYSNRGAAFGTVMGLVNTAIQIGGFLKPMLEIPFIQGHLAGYSRISFGLGYALGWAQVSLIENDADMDRLGAPGNNMTHQASLFPVAYSFPLEGSLGFEYFPAYFMGFFLEAGYRGTYDFYPVTIRSIPSNARSYKEEIATTTWRGLWAHGFSASTGLKFTF